MWLCPVCVLPHSEMKVLVMRPKEAMLAWTTKTHLNGSSSSTETPIFSSSVLKPCPLKIPPSRLNNFCLLKHQSQGRCKCNDPVKRAKKVMTVSIATQKFSNVDIVWDDKFRRRFDHAIHGSNRLQVHKCDGFSGCIGAHDHQR